MSEEDKPTGCLSPERCGEICGCGGFPDHGHDGSHAGKPWLCAFCNKQPSGWVPPKEGPLLGGKEKTTPLRKMSEIDKARLMEVLGAGAAASKEVYELHGKLREHFRAEDLEFESKQAVNQKVAWLDSLLEPMLPEPHNTANALDVLIQMASLSPWNYEAIKRARLVLEEAKGKGIG